MKRLILLAVVLGLPGGAGARPVGIRCPGNTTMEMRDCASRSWEQSTGRLRQTLTAPQLQQWQNATASVCARAYAPYRDGTIGPQLVVGCNDRLNRALLNEFKPMDSP